MTENNNIDNELNESIDYGVMRDKLDNSKFVFWSVLGIVILVITVIGVNSLYHYNKFLVQEKMSTAQEFREIKTIKDNAATRLNTAGVVDAENNIYHIPIEDAISLYLNEVEN